MQIKSHKSVEQIAKKHRLDVSFIQNQLSMGIPIEHEHTRDKILATDIALQHLDEIPDYYTRLKKMEASAKKEHKKFKDIKEDAVTDLQRGLTELEDASYDSVDSLMRRIMKKRNVTAKQLHNDFVNKHKKTPDSWIKDKNQMKEKKGLWPNIHARREKGLPRKKPGQKGYPKTLDIEEGLKQARKNVGASKCWPGKVATGTKMKDGEEVPDCHPVKEETGMVRYCPKCAKEETKDECKYGPKYWDMYSMPTTLKHYTPNSPHPANEDYEYSMARSEISTIIGAAKRLRKKISKGEGNLEAWVQSKITKAADYIDTAADYVDSGEMKKESVSIEDANGNHYVQFIDIIKPQPLKPSRGIGSRLVGEGAFPPEIDPSAHKQAQRTQKLYNKGIGTDNSNEKEIFLKRTGPQLPLAKKEDKKELQTSHYDMKTFGDFMSESSAAWQRKEGKNPEGGLNKKGISSYHKEHPGSHLSLAVTTKPSKLKKGSKSANRRKSFCSRMSGMKAKLTSAKTAHDPNSRINKSLRKWNC